MIRAKSSRASGDLPLLRRARLRGRRRKLPPGAATWVSYTSDESGRREVYVQPFPLTGAKFQISTDGGTDGRWRGDGKEMFYLAPDRTLVAVPLSWSGKTLLPSTPQALFTAPTSGLPIGVGMRFLYAASHDGERFLIQTDGGKSSPADMVVVLNWTAALEE